MSFYDDASLVFLPSGGAGKDTKAYSIKPTNGDGDFTFSRGSNLTATRVDSNGLIEKGRENLLLQSNQFDTTWGTPKTDVTSGQSGYDGSSDAWLLEADVAGSSANMNQAVSISGVTTASIYAKEGTTNWFRFSINDSGVNTRAWFDLSGSGAVGTTAGNIIDTNIEGVSNGYFRCSITFNATAANLYIFIANADNSISYSVGDNIYIQDAQLEQGLVATEYIESGASTGLAGILEDSPRFDYSGGASCPSLLLEPSRTNTIEYSEYFDGFSKSGPPTLNLENINSPEGVENAYSIVKRSAENTGDRVQQSLGGLGTNYIFSVFLKLKSTTDTFNVRLANNQGERVEAVVSTDGTMVVGGATNATNYDIENYGNGWYRLWMETTTSASSNFYQLYPNITNTSVGKCHFYGAQVEEGSYPTSYMPNNSGGSVTREADTNTTANISSVIGQQEGTFFLDFEFLDGTTAENQNWIALESEDGQSRVLFYKSAASNNLRLLNSQDGSTFFNKSSLIAISPNTRYKVAVRYDSGDQGVAVNGSMSGSNGTATYTRTSLLSRVKFNESNIQPSCRVHQAIVFDSGLTDSELETLTS